MVENCIYGYIVKAVVKAFGQPFWENLGGGLCGETALSPP